MRPASRYVTRAEFEPVKQGLERLTIRVEVLTNDVHTLTNRVADIAEDLLALRTEMNERFRAIDVRFDRLEKTIADGHAALLSAILRLSPA